ncbi:MAG: Crp/Fnr family transcriptional regulator [Pseudomonadota bacterium]
MTETKSLAQIELFADLDRETLDRLEARCRWRRYKANERILEYGSEAREVFFILEGSVHIVNTGLTGREVAFARILAGDCFGELSAIDGKPRSASAVAAEPAYVALLQAAEFHRLLEERVEVTFKVLFRLAQMVRAGDVRIMELSTLAATQRVYAELLRMAQPDAAVDGLWVVRPLPPLREIASRVSTTRETVARALSQLYADGLLRRKGRNLYLMDRDKLTGFLAASSGSKAT